MRNVLRKTPLEVGNLIAWIVLSASAGFIIGWIVNAHRIAQTCFPVV
jgi:hypothetical protein